LGVPPAFALAVVLILLGTQVAYVIAPKRPHYLVRLGISALAVVIGELLAAVGVAGRLALGELHPLNDLALLAVLQWVGGRWAGRGEATV
jgi:hypothetical protein